MPFTIRPANVADADALTCVQVESWKTTYPGIVPDSFLDRIGDLITSAKWKERLQSGELQTFVSEGENGVVGFVTGGRLREPVDGPGECDGELHAIYLLREVQRQGLGRKLTQSLASALRSQGMRSMLVWVLEENPAVSFYQQLGAVMVAQKYIDIGGKQLSELALCWPSIDELLADADQPIQQKCMRPTGE